MTRLYSAVPPVSERIDRHGIKVSASLRYAGFRDMKVYGHTYPAGCPPGGRQMIRRRWLHRRGLDPSHHFDQECLRGNMPLAKE